MGGMDHSDELKQGKKSRGSRSYLATNHSDLASIVTSLDLHL